MTNKKAFIVADLRKLEFMVSRGEISYSRMVEILNEKAEKFHRLQNEIDFCSFAEWFGAYKLDSLNGGHYMHSSSGMESNRLFNILEIHEHYQKMLLDVQQEKTDNKGVLEI